MSCQLHAQMNFGCMSLFILAAHLTVVYFRDKSLILLDLKQQALSTLLARLQQCKQRRGECEERRTNQFLGVLIQKHREQFLHLVRLLLHIISKSSLL